MNGSLAEEMIPHLLNIEFSCAILPQCRIYTADLGLAVGELHDIFFIEELFEIIGKSTVCDDVLN